MTKHPRAILIGLISIFFSANKLLSADDAPNYLEHQDLSYYLDGSGHKQPIKTKNDWQIRRGHILANLHKVMGDLPRPEKPVPLAMKVLEETAVGDLVRKKISYHTDSAEQVVTAYVFFPPNPKKLPAILCLHQTTGIGKGEPAGLGGNPNLHYALHLAQRGYVTLAPDYPSFGDYKYDFDSKYGYKSGSMKAIYDNIRAIDLLASLKEVDAERIGCIGHSLGGHNTIFTAVHDTRIKVAVSNCGFTRFHKYYEGKLAGWTSPRYMPLIASEYGNNPDKVPFDFPELIAALAPRAFLASSPVGDSNFEVSGVKDTIAAAKSVFKLLGVEENLAANYPDCAHDFPENVRKVAYDFLDKHLQK
ncbi:MAG: prolyl oligopeptidase family serine peptidase [Planctomycetales bacterium]|nr:prolyl oligopeptidase family serine peptidase [Planctomycetales bacterium]